MNKPISDPEQLKRFEAAEAAHDEKTNADPISGEHGSHPLGVAAGATCGAAAGAVLGALGGPVGVVAGAAAGTIAGGIVGKELGEVMSPSVEDAYWKSEFMSRPYYVTTRTYDCYQPAYRFGWESYVKHQGREWGEVEADLMLEWQGTEPKLEWSEAKPATRDAWERVAKARRQ